MSGVFQNIDPPPLPPTARRVCVLYPPPLVRGEDTLHGWRGGWGVNFVGRRQTQLCILHMSVLCVAKAQRRELLSEPVLALSKAKDEKISIDTNVSIDALQSIEVFRKTKLN